MLGVRNYGYLPLFLVALLISDVSSSAFRSAGRHGGRHGDRQGDKHGSKGPDRQTSTGEECPSSSGIQCDPNFEYRTSNGVCNNLDHPLRGAAGIPFVRYLASDYEDGISSPRGEGRISPAPIPTARQVSAALSEVPTPPNNSPISLLVMQWGQFIDHDMVFTPVFEDDQCCADGTDLTITSSECRPLDVRGDTFFSQFGVQCLSFVRSLSSECSTVTHREQMNSLTSFIDGSQVYGSSLEAQINLRTLQGGQLKIGPGEEQLIGTCLAICPFTFLPVRTTDNGEDEFFAGDVRVQEQPGLTSMHTMFLRAHNDLAAQLSDVYGSSVTDEDLFQETRRIIGAIIQQITFGEFLPLVLGSTSMNQHNLFPLSVGSNQYSQGYSSNIDSSAANVFATAAFRFGHSLISDNFVLRTQTVPLAESFENHDVTLNFGSFPSDFLEGMGFASSEGMDHFLVEAITNKLFAEGPSFSHGTDLMALNIMRGRDHGLPPYNAWRNLCQLPRINSFEDLANVMPLQTAQQFASTYAFVDDIDIFPAAIAEFPVGTGSGILGPTLTCIIGKYFHDLKFGDRFFYESNAQPRPFTFNQLDIIRRTTLASMICAYTDTPEVQRQAMVVPIQGNPIKDCSAILPNTVPDLIRLAF